MNTRFPSSRTDCTSVTAVVVFHWAVPSCGLKPQTTPPVSTKTTNPGRAAMNPGRTPARVHTVSPVPGSTAITGPVESAAKMRVPSVARGEARGTSRGFSHREMGGKGALGGRIFVLAQEDATSKALRTVQRTGLSALFRSPIAIFQSVVELVLYSGR